MLLDYDVMADRESQARAFPRWLGCKERVENLFSNLLRDPSTIVPYASFDARSQVACSHEKSRREVRIVKQRFAFSRSVKGVRNQIEKNAHDFLWVNVHLARCWIELLFQGHIEVRRLCSCAM